MRCLLFILHTSLFVFVYVCFFLYKKKKTAHSLDCVYGSVILYEERTATGQQSATFNTAGIRDSTDYGPFVTRAEGHQIFISFDQHMLLQRTYILCNLSFQSVIERKLLKVVFLYFQRRLKNQMLVYCGKRPEMSALAIC